MEKFVDKFNIFDLFTMLIPGILISCLFGITFSIKFYNVWETCGNEKYFLFFVFSYACGLIFQELGTILDNLILNFILYGGDPKEIFLLDNRKRGFRKVFKNQLFCQNATKIFQNAKKYMHIPESENTKELNSLFFGYCLNICEMEGISWKADKMLVVSEMSRSLALGCFSACILNIIFNFSSVSTTLFFKCETIVLFIAGIIFLIRKKRYEIYRIEMIIRTYSIYICKKTRSRKVK